MRLLVWLLTALTLVFFLGPASAQPSRGPLVIVLLPGTTLTDWRQADAPHLHHVMTTGALAVMNTRTARLPNDHTRESPESALLTLGAGSRAAGGGAATEFHPAGAYAGHSSLIYGALYARRMGTTVPDQVWVDAEWPRVLRENQERGYDLLPGNLGEALGRHGLPITTGGGSQAFPIATDAHGLIRSVWPGSQFPDRLPPCLIWDCGTDVHGADTLIATTADAVRVQQGRLIVISPFVRDREYAQGRRLAPVLVWGPGVTAGLLFSPSTHRAGLVTNTDFAPSVAAYFGASSAEHWLPSTAFGRPWEVRPASESVVTVSRLEEQAYRQEAAMRLLPAVALLLGALIAASALLRNLGRSTGMLPALPGVVIFSVLVSHSPITLVLWGGGLTALVLAGQRYVSTRTVIVGTDLLIIATLVGDTLLGNPWMRQSMLGYSAVEGARYYGIGNEAMGPLVGAALVSATALWGTQRARQLLIAAGLISIALLLGLPSAGAKAGGLLVAVAGFAVLLWALWNGRWRAALLIPLLALMAAALLMLSFGDWRHGGQQTHIGQAVSRIASHGMGEGTDIISRKLAVEGRLLYHSTWAVPLWLGLLALCSEWKRIRNSTEMKTRALFAGGGAAVLACLAVNDAGVVAAALCGTVVWSGLVELETPKGPRRLESVLSKTV